MSDEAIRTEADAVDRASGWAEKLLARIYRGPGDSIETAMHRAETTYGIPQSLFWALRYRKPKTIAAAAFYRLKSTYDAVCASQEAKLRHELEIAKTLPPTPARLDLIREVEAVLGSGDPQDLPTTPSRLAG